MVWVAEGTGGRWVYVDRVHVDPDCFGLQNLASFVPDHSVPPPPPRGVDLTRVGQTRLRPRWLRRLQMHADRSPTTGNLAGFRDGVHILKPGKYLTANTEGGWTAVYDHHTGRWGWVHQGGE